MQSEHTFRKTDAESKREPWTHLEDGTKRAIRRQGLAGTALLAIGVDIGFAMSVAPVNIELTLE